MTRRRKFLALIVTLVVVTATIALWPRPSRLEPIYKGRKLSLWIGELTLTLMRGGRPHDDQREAIRLAGTNGIPFYLKWIAWEPNALRKKLDYCIRPTVAAWLNKGYI